MMKKIIYLAVAAVLLLPFTFANAAYNDVTTEAVANIVLPTNSLSYLLEVGTQVESFTVNDSSIVFSMPSGSVVQLISTDKSNFTVSGGDSCAVSKGCTAVQSYVVVTCNAATTQTVTLTLTSGTCTISGGSTGGGGGGGGGGAPAPAPAAPAPAPAAIAPVALAPAPVAPAPAAPVAVVTPVSAVAISNVSDVSFQPGEALKYTYQYKNKTAKTVKVKVVRELTNSKGKVIKSTTLYKRLKSGSLLVSNVKDTLDKKLPAGEYTVKVKILGDKNKVLDQNTFNIEVEKLKAKVFELGEAASVDSDIAFDAITLAKVKSGVKLPVSLKLKYSYTNNSGAYHTVKMTRTLINSAGKVLGTKTGKWTMKVKEKDSSTFTQALAATLSPDTYTIRISAYDWKTKELLAENSLEFIVELK